MIKQPEKVQRLSMLLHNMCSISSCPSDHKWANTRFGEFLVFIDLTFTSQPNLGVDSDVLPSLHTNCHHQIMYVNFNSKFHFTLPYEQEIWHNGLKNTEVIRRAFHKFNWQRAFSSININERVYFFNKTIFKIV